MYTRHQLSICFSTGATRRRVGLLIQHISSARARVTPEKPPVAAQSVNMPPRHSFHPLPAVCRLCRSDCALTKHAEHFASMGSPATIMDN